MKITSIKCDREGCPQGAGLSTSLVLEVKTHNTVLKRFRDSGGGTLISGRTAELVQAAVARRNGDTLDFCCEQCVRSWVDAQLPQLPLPFHVFHVYLPPNIGQVDGGKWLLVDMDSTKQALHLHTTTQLSRALKSTTLAGIMEVLPDVLREYNYTISVIHSYQVNR